MSVNLWAFPRFKKRGRAFRGARHRLQSLTQALKYLTATGCLPLNLKSNAFNRQI